jgi:ribosomal protein RSM22 (predicted rRNA methylase)
VLDLCTADGLECRTVSKRDGADYRTARKVGWGDTL